MRNLIAVAALSALATCAYAQVTVPGADGSDGAFTPAFDTEIDLSLSPVAAWNGANPDPNTPLTGVYDADKWAVVFRYTEVNIPPGVTVTFKNRDGRPPVVWLVSGDVTINGTLDLDGEDYHLPGDLGLAEPGPGGFRGGLGSGISADSSAGFGPGGATKADDSLPAGGSHATEGEFASGYSSVSGPTYNNARVIPLIGGSGAAGQYYLGSNARGGGAGGGAILICSEDTISISSTGSILARGGDSHQFGGGAGSGGGIRLVSDTIAGPGTLNAGGGYGQMLGGAGRIRLEANSIDPSITHDPPYTAGSPGATVTVWPEATAPTIRVTQLHTEPVPADPWASMAYPFADVSIAIAEPVTVDLTANNMPLDWVVTVRVVPRNGADQSVSATFLSGDETESYWQASVVMPQGFSAVQARASAPETP